MKLNLQYFIPVFAVTIFFTFTGLIFSQTAEIPSHIEPYILESGYHTGNGETGTGAVMMYSGSITVPGIPWIQVSFSEADLGEASYLIITSLQDNYWQKLDAVSIRQWNYFSAFFNGGELIVELFVSPQDKAVNFKVNEIVAGDWAQDGIESICGPTDDRQLSNQQATGRVLNVGCTGWIIPNGKIVSAGHCLASAGSVNVLQFNVPPSLPNGTLQHPGPEDQYSANTATRVFVNGGVGNDWGVFEVFPNSITSLMPKEAQGAYWPLVQNLSPDSITIIGYGTASGVRNQVQQTHIGPNASSSGTTMRYRTDTTGGNSGSPVIDDATNVAVGVHTHGGCTSTGGSNSGTSLFSAVFWTAVDMGAGGCSVGPATAPTPTNGSTNISINLALLSWSNGSNSVSNELYFGTNPSSLSLVQSGSLATSWNISGGPLTYATNYYWRVDEIGDSCDTPGPVWSFTTELDPMGEIDQLYCTDFTAGVGDFTITNEGGTCLWQSLTTTSNTYTLPATAQGNVLGADSDLCGSGTTLLSTARLTNALNFAAQNYFYVEIKFDNDWRIIDAADEAHVELSTNGGSTWTSVWSRVGVDQRNSTEIIDVTSYAGQSSVQIRFRTVQPGWDWWWVIDNLCITGHWVVPVELTSFTADVVGSTVALNWITATETNNQGFQIERSNGEEFTSVGFAAGHGTTTEIQNYSFIDRNVEPGSYSYRLKQIDYDGTFEYSNVIETDVVSPAEFTLDQNYPNPFNPSTRISFRLAADSKVSLKVFDVLGQEVMTLVNSEMTAGLHSVDFDASGLNSGVYFYKIEAGSNSGVQFTDVKKMILTK